MKTVMKMAMLASALMVAQPVFAHECKDADGKAVACKTHHKKRHHDAKAKNESRTEARYDAYHNNDTRYNRARYEARRDDTRFNNRTYWGYNIQSVNNPGEVQESMRTVVKH